MITKIHTRIYHVRVRTNYNMDLLCQKYFFNLENAEEFKNQMEENLDGITIFMDTIHAEDTIVYQTKEKGQ